MHPATTPTLFLSYSRLDLQIVKLIYIELLIRFRGKVWFDLKDIPPGAEWQTAIDAGLAQCTMLLLIASTEALSSPYVREEVNKASAAGKSIHVWLIDNCPIDLLALLPPLASFYDMREDPLSETMWQHGVEQLRSSTHGSLTDSSAASGKVIPSYVRRFNQRLAFTVTICVAISLIADLFIKPSIAIALVSLALLGLITFLVIYAIKQTTERKITVSIFMVCTFACVMLYVTQMALTLIELPILDPIKTLLMFSLSWGLPIIGAINLDWYWGKPTRAQTKATTTDTPSQAQLTNPSDFIESAKKRAISSIIQLSNKIEMTLYGSNGIIAWLPLTPHRAKQQYNSSNPISNSILGAVPRSFDLALPDNFGQVAFVSAPEDANFTGMCTFILEDALDGSQVSKIVLDDHPSIDVSRFDAIFIIVSPYLTKYNEYLDTWLTDNASSSNIFPIIIQYTQVLTTSLGRFQWLEGRRNFHQLIENIINVLCGVPPTTRYDPVPAKRILMSSQHGNPPVVPAFLAPALLFTAAIAFAYFIGVSIAGVAAISTPNPLLKSQYFFTLVMFMIMTIPALLGVWIAFQLYWSRKITVEFASLAMLYPILSTVGSNSWLTLFICSGLSLLYTIVILVPSIRRKPARWLQTYLSNSTENTPPDTVFKNSSPRNKLRVTVESVLGFIPYLAASYFVVSQLSDYIFFFICLGLVSPIVSRTIRVNLLALINDGNAYFAKYGFKVPARTKWLEEKINLVAFDAWQPAMAFEWRPFLIFTVVVLICTGSSTVLKEFHHNVQTGNHAPLNVSIPNNINGVNVLNLRAGSAIEHKSDGSYNLLEANDTFISPSRLNLLFEFQNLPLTTPVDFEILFNGQSWYTSESIIWDIPLNQSDPASFGQITLPLVSDTPLVSGYYDVFVRVAGTYTAHMSFKIIAQAN